MNVTISEIVRSSDINNDLMRKWCEIAAENGGRFSITEYYKQGSAWFNRYEIVWPEGMKEPSQ